MKDQRQGANCGTSLRRRLVIPACRLSAGLFGSASPAYTRRSILLLECGIASSAPVTPKLVPPRIRIRTLRNADLGDPISFYARAELRNRVSAF